MKEIITDMTVTENISLVTLSQVDNSHGVLAAVFGGISACGVNVDMISQSYPAKQTVELSFTVPDSELPLLLKYLGEHREHKASVFSGNTKISFFGKDMESRAGVAAYVFSLFAKAECDIKMVTTSTCDISCLVSPELVGAVIKCFEESE